MFPPPIIATGVLSSGNWGIITGGMLAFAGGVAGWLIHAWRSPKLPDNEKLALLRELSHQEAQFRFIFDSVPVGISLKFREQGKNLLWHINDEHLRIAGLTRKEVLDGTAEDRFREITHPEDWARQQIFRDQLEAGEIDRFDIEKRYILQGGRTVWVAFTTLHRKLPDGVELYLNTAVDITAQKAQASELAAAKAEANDSPAGDCQSITRRSRGGLSGSISCIPDGQRWTGRPRSARYDNRRKDSRLCRRARPGIRFAHYFYIPARC